MKLDPANAFHMNFKAFLDATAPGLADGGDVDLGGIVHLPSAQADSIVANLLHRACQATHEASIQLGQIAAAELPRSWLLERIERIAEREINLDDAWEYRLLLDLYATLDGPLLSRLVRRGLACANPDIVEAVNDYAGRAVG